MKVLEAAAVFLILIVLTACTAYSQQQFVHTVSAQNKYCNSTCSLLTVPELTNNPGAIIIVTPILVNGVNPNPHPVGVYYTDPKKWSIINVDGATIADGAKFNVEYYASPSSNQFAYVIPGQNAAPCLDHPALNNNSNAQVRFSPTQSPRGAYFNKDEVKIDFDASTSKWCLTNVNGQPMRSATAFNIVITSGVAGPSGLLPSAVAAPRKQDAQAIPSGTPIPLAFGNQNDFSEKGLPASAPGPTSDLDLAAMVMAKEISRSDERSLPMLLTALQTAGFSIIDENGSVVRKHIGTGGGLGLAIYDFEAVGALKLAGPGSRISLVKLSETITKESPQISGLQFANLILNDLRMQVDSTNPYLRFYGRLIVELGKTSTEPLDLLKAPAEQVKVSMLQATLLIRRIQGTMFSLQKGKPTGSLLRPPSLSRSSFIPASWRLNNMSVFRAMSFSPPDPCPLSGDGALALDAAAIKLSAWNGSLLGGFESSVIGKIGKGVGVANAVLAWAKLVASVTKMKGEITVQKPLPLVRTLNSTAGQKRLMIARLWVEVDKLETLNCLRPTLNLVTGLDFNLPTGGPMADVAVEWRFAGENETRVNNEATRNTQKFVVFEADKGANPDPLRQVSADNGLSKMWLVGAPKIPTVVNSSPLIVDKSAEVVVGVTLKSAKDFRQNSIDFLGMVLGVATAGNSGDPWGLLGLVGSAAEIGYRAPWVAARATIPVIDHEPCTAEWHGTVTYNSIYASTTESDFKPFPVPSAKGAGSTGSNTRSNSTITLAGTAWVFGTAWEADASADAVYTSNTSSGGKEYCHGGPNGPIGPLVGNGGSDTTVNFGGGTSSGKASGSISLDKDFYTISIKPLTINGSYQTSHQISSTGGCSAHPTQSFSSSSNRQYGGNDYIVGKAAYGRDRNVLSGSDSTTRSTPSQSTSGEPKKSLGISTSRSNTTVTNSITWNLRRCT